ncbi:hypothetical protein BH20BAC1_BH20BAC1_12930 [soil metagenome]
MELISKHKDERIKASAQYAVKNIARIAVELNNVILYQLKSKGVEFTKQPTKEFYKTEAVFKDDSGNWFSLGEEK